MKKLMLFISLFGVVSQVHSAVWELNDVSILFGLPHSKDGKDFLLAAHSQGNFGPLFPRAHAKAIEDLVFGSDRPEPEDIHQSIRVVGMRIDPCFKFSAAASEKCTPQMRLVWQPTKGLATDHVQTLDAAVHTFYKLSASEFKKLTHNLQALKYKYAQQKIKTNGLPLNVHPAFLNPKTRASFNQDLKNIILSTAGENNFVRFTFMKLMTPEIWWSFGGMDKQKDGTWKSIVIPRLAATDIKQDFFNDSYNDQVGMRGTLIPNVTPKENNLAEIATGWGLHEDKDGEKLIKKSFTSINKIENPKLNSPATMDCVHCHIAEPIKTWVDKNHSKMARPNQTNESRFSGSWGQNLSNPTNQKKNNKSLRSFGYKNATPSINQRAINESASVAQTLNQTHP
jgi:hypothetical protein